jgi:hypothetical protein
MAAISGNLTDAETSASFTPSNDISDVICTDNTGQGEVLLEVYEPTAAKWVAIANAGVYSVSTPDTGLVYRFRSIGVGADFDYYMGP